MPTTPVDSYAVPLREQYEQHHLAAVHALSANDVAAAYDHLLTVQAIYDLLPDAEKTGLALRYRSIEALMKRLERKRLGGAVTRLPVEYRRPDLEGTSRR